MLILMTVFCGSAHAQTDPWTTTAKALLAIFTGPLARAFVVVAIVISGLTLAFSESGGKRGLAGLFFGGALAIGASQMAAILFQ
jgi:type IV secretory pathway VirB2 component (pilin)